MAHDNHGVLRKNASLIMVIQRMLDPLIIVGILLACARAWEVDHLRAYGILAISVILLSIPILKGVGLYHPYRVQSFRDLVLKICLSWFVLLSILLFFAFFLKASETFSRPALASWAILTPLSLVLTHSLIWKVLQRLRSKGQNQRYAVIAGINPGSKHLAQQIHNTANLGIKIQGFFAVNPSSPEALALAGNHPPMLGSLQQLPAYVRDRNIDIVYLSFPITDEGKMNYLLRNLQDTTACVYYVPDILTFNLMYARTYELGDIPLISVWEIPFSDLQLLSKRAIDITVAAILLFLLSPAMLMISIAIAFTSPGPILLKQKRYGLNGEKIIVYKFRSKFVEEPRNQNRATPENQSKITKVGAFLRRTSLDQLPQFINVLQGTMSIVGPLPHAVTHNENYRKLISGYMLRHKVKPGITSWAQVNGFKGETDTLETIEKRIEFDLAYLREWSLWLDFKIMAKTALGLLGNSNAY
jgi:putative colanic acid biosysnthesis UDP-glucose lipid carrier transferase